MKQNEPLRLAIIFAFLAFLACPALAQSPAASIAVYRLENSGADESTVLVASDLLFSFIREMRDYSLDFISSTRAEAESAGEALAQDASHDLALYGKILAAQGEITLELCLKGKGAETRVISRTYENQNRLMLGTRLLVRELFESNPLQESLSLPLAQSAAPPQEAEDVAPLQQEEESALDIEALALGDVLSVDALAGSWSAEQGIERIMILRGGRGAAVFSSGFSLMLSLSLEEGELVVLQRGRSSPLQFVDLPDPVAEKAAEQAPPIEWRFRISADGNILAGEKSNVQVAHDGQNILSITPTKEAVAWFRN